MAEDKKGGPIGFVRDLLVLIKHYFLLGLIGSFRFVIRFFKGSIRFIKKNIVLFKFYFLLAYFLLLIFFIMHWNVTKVYFEDNLTKSIAQTVGVFYKVFGIEVKVVGSAIRLENFGYSIIYDCAGVFSMTIYLSAILAFPATWKEKLKGIGVGIPFLFLLNSFRMFVLGLVGMRFNYKVFDRLEEQGRQECLILSL
jgi:exosortase/archaeosortase family protein